MSGCVPNESGGRNKGKRSRAVKAQAEPVRACTCIDVEQTGDWIPVDELCASALAAVSAGNDVSINLDRVEHLDASALQVLLALNAEQKRQGRNLELSKVSPHLRQWFDYAGAADQFSMTDRKK
jgi:anti-anti-sigma factor